MIINQLLEMQQQRHRNDLIDRAAILKNKSEKYKKKIQ